MPRACKCCAHPELAAITKALAQGVSYRDISSRYKVTAASVHRHASRCLRLVRRPEKSAASEERVKVADSSRFDSEGRCQKCGTLLDDPKPEALVSRAERLLWIAETIAARAQRDDDARLALQAVDRARGSLDQLLKVHGLLQPDGMTVNVNAEQMTLRKAFSIVTNAIDGEKRQVTFLRLFRAFWNGDEIEIPALPSTIENETPIRDVKSEIVS